MGEVAKVMPAPELLVIDPMAASRAFPLGELSNPQTGWRAELMKYLMSVVKVTNLNTCHARSEGERCPARHAASSTHTRFRAIMSRVRRLYSLRWAQSGQPQLSQEPSGTRPVCVGPAGPSIKTEPVPHAMAEPVGL